MSARANNLISELQLVQGYFFNEGEDEGVQRMVPIISGASALLDFVRASECCCTRATALSTGVTLPAYQCARCDALAQAGAK